MGFEQQPAANPAVALQLFAFPRGEHGAMHVIVQGCMFLDVLQVQLVNHVMKNLNRAALEYGVYRWLQVLGLDCLELLINAEFVATSAGLVHQPPLKGGSGAVTELVSKDTV